MRSEFPPLEGGRLSGGFVGSGAEEGAGAGMDATGATGAVGVWTRGGGEGMPSPTEGAVIGRPVASTGA